MQQRTPEIETVLRKFLAKMDGFANPDKNTGIDLGSWLHYLAFDVRIAESKLSERSPSYREVSILIKPTDLFDCAFTSADIQIIRGPQIMLHKDSRYAILDQAPSSILTNEKR